MPSDPIEAALAILDAPWRPDTEVRDYDDGDSITRKWFCTTCGDIVYNAHTVSIACEYYWRMAKLRAVLEAARRG